MPITPQDAAKAWEARREAAKESLFKQIDEKLSFYDGAPIEIPITFGGAAYISPNTEIAVLPEVFKVYRDLGWAIEERTIANARVAPIFSAGAQ